MELFKTKSEEKENHMLKLTIQQITYFLDLCETLNFTETARKYYVSQPALSRHISILEEKAGTQLFIRNHRNVALTPEGELVKKEFLTFMEQCNHMMDSVSQIANHKKGTLRLAFSEYLELTPICSNYIYPYSQKYPLVQLVCECLDFTNIKQKLYDDDVDILFLPEYELDLSARFSVTEISSETIGVIIPFPHPLFHMQEFDPSLLEDTPLLLVDNNTSSAFSKRALSVCKKLGLTPKHLIFSPTIASLLSSLICGAGYTISNIHVVNSNPTVLKAFCTDILHPEPICAIWNKQNHNFALKDFQAMLLK